MKEAVLAACDEAVANGEENSEWTVKLKHFEQVVTNISPSVSDWEIQHYLSLAKSFHACNV